MVHERYVHFFNLASTFRDAMATWSVRSSPDRVVWVRDLSCVLGQDIALTSADLTHLPVLTTQLGAENVFSLIKRTIFI